MTCHRSFNMFIVGGEERGRYLGLTYSFNFLTLGFTKCANMIEGKANFGSIYFRDLLFAIGGWR